MAEEQVLLVTCEHGGNTVPTAYKACFQDDREVLKTHQAFDLGALELAKELADSLGANLIQSTVTRLIVDLNRSLSNPRVFSPYTKNLTTEERKAILDTYYHPYRHRVEETILQSTGSAVRMVHVSVHSFTSRFNGVLRYADIGLLYDPQREAEKHLCMSLQSELAKCRPDLIVRRNYPYRGTDDGLTRYLRRRFTPDKYLGIELEINQKWPLGDTGWRGMRSNLIGSLAHCVQFP